MELRLVELALRILDPRKWRLRLAQAVGTIGALLWIWYRAVDRVDVDRTVRDARRQERRSAIRERARSTERDRLLESVR